MGLPEGIRRHVGERLLERLHPLAILLWPDYLIHQWQGDPEHFGLPPLQPGTDARDPLPALHGLPLDRATRLAFVEAPSGGAYDLELVPVEAGTLVVLGDVSDERDWRRQVQQQANDIRLLSQRQARLLGELEQARAALERKHREAEAASRVKSRFIASLSHEFRTPLAAILGRVELLRGDRRREADLAAIEGNANHLMSLMDNILDQARIESGRMELLPLPTDPAALGRELAAMFEPLARKRGLVLEWRTDTLPERVRLDPVRLRQVLINLMGNALKFTPAGRVSLSLGWSGGVLSATVQDTGPGVPGEARERIFQAFHQESGGDGVGLGLAISAQLVSLMGGRLELDSRPGRGARFSFRVPAPLCESTQDGKKGEGALVLVADDSDDLRSLLVHQLANGGYEVSEAADATALERQVPSRRPAALLLDLYLGERDGAELAGSLRSGGYDGCILMLSASSLPEDRERALAAGCDDYLVKPVRREVLLDRLGNLLDGRLLQSDGHRTSAGEESG